VAARPAWPARSPASEPLVEEAWARYVMGGRALYDAGASVGFFAEMLRRRWRLLRPGETVVISFYDFSTSFKAFTDLNLTSGAVTCRRICARTSSPGR
jgi:hypothetical protein